MHTHRRPCLKLVDLLAATAIVAVCVAYWKLNSLSGWIATTIGCSAIAYFVNHVRAKPPFFKSMLFAIPVIVLAAFFMALIFGIRDPSYVVPFDSHQPPSYSVEKRSANAFNLSILALFFSTPTIIALGMLRRTMILYGFLERFGISASGSSASGSAFEEICVNDARVESIHDHVID